jgi:septation ring formation regulator EzrA
MNNLDYMLGMAVILYIAVKNHEIKKELQALRENASKPPPNLSITKEQGDTIIELLQQIEPYLYKIHSELSEVKDQSSSAAGSLSSIAEDVGEIERK